VLINYLLGKSLYPVTIDFEEYQDKGNQIRFLSSALSKRVTGQLSQSTKLLAIKPDTLELIYTRGEGKKVPVCLRGEVEAERQYYISERIFSPDSVMVYAPQEILDTITAAYTEALYVEEISDTTRHRAGIMPVKGARFTPSYSDITFMVDMYSEKTVEVPVQGVNFPEDKLLRTFPSKVQVTFQIGLRQFKTVNAEDFTVVVDYQTLEKEKSEKCKPVLLKSPANVNLIRVAPAEIDYIIEQKIMFND
jgi:YbbR domain-containing protein